MPSLKLQACPFLPAEPDMRWRSDSGLFDVRLNSLSASKPVPVCSVGIGLQYYMLYWFMISVRLRRFFCQYTLFFLILSACFYLYSVVYCAFQNQRLMSYSSLYVTHESPFVLSTLYRANRFIIFIFCIQA